MADDELTTVSGVITNGEVDDETQDALLDNLKQLRTEAVDLFGTSKVMEVPGYKGLMAVEYAYISSEVTEHIAREVRRETKNVNGIGTNLLASLDTLIASSKNILIRKEAGSEWVNKDGSYAPGVHPINKSKQVNFKSLELSRILDYPADDSREVVLGVYGSEHKVIEANIILSRWMTDKTRTADEDFLG
jgi:hypothetical protein